MPTRLDRPLSSYGRSAVLARSGMVATSQPLAAVAGLRMLLAGGNAIDAAIATAAALNVVEPMSTGIGGDAFALYWSAQEGRLKGINGSGRSPAAMTPDLFRARGHRKVPTDGMLPVTVPGAVDCWQTLLEADGTMPLAEVLAPAIAYAEGGFPVSEIIANGWRASERRLREACPESAENYLIGGRAPRCGEIWRQPNMARSLRRIAEGGREAFYRGEIAGEICAFSAKYGGLLRLEDFARHESVWVEPISAPLAGSDVELYELPPNGQGMAALVMLNVLADEDLKGLGHNRPEYLHRLLEAKKLAYAERDAWCCDPDVVTPLDTILSADHARTLRAQITARALPRAESHIARAARDTVYLVAADRHGNMVSFINSLFAAWGSAMVAGRTGIPLQNRGAGFVLEDGHPNQAGPSKRPLHTIIPGFALKGGRPWLAFGVMGGHMQAQGHVQVLLNRALFGMNLQEALEAPRFNHLAHLEVGLERGIGGAVREALVRRGHRISPQLGPWGGAQAIERDLESGVYAAASEPRKDGCAIGY